MKIRKKRLSLRIALILSPVSGILKSESTGVKRTVSVIKSAERTIGYHCLQNRL